MQLGQSAAGCGERIRESQEILAFVIATNVDDFTCRHSRQRRCAFFDAQQITPNSGDIEGVANGEIGPPLGRELEIAELLKFIKDQSIANVVFITADVHYAAAHYYDPAAAKFTEFTPFWEFIAGPAHAGTFGPGQLDATFGPQLKFLSIPKGMKGNRPPSEGYQFFGTLQISAATKTLTAKLHNVAGQEIYTMDLPAA